MLMFSQGERLQIISAKFQNNVIKEAKQTSSNGVISTNNQMFGRAIWNKLP